MGGLEVVHGLARHVHVLLHVFKGHMDLECGGHKVPLDSVHLKVVHCKEAVPEGLDSGLVVLLVKLLGHTETVKVQDGLSPLEASPLQPQ